MALIGLHGRAHVGKDSVGDILCQRFGYSRLSFAGPIKDGLIAMLGPWFGIRREHFSDPQLKEKPIEGIGMSPRRLMQTLGTGWGRDVVGETLWVEVALRALRQHWKFTRNVVVTDVRYDNEADWIRRSGGQVWHVTRKLPANVAPLHPSEFGLPIVVGEDSLLENDAGLEQLTDQVKAALAGELTVTGHSLQDDVH